MSWALDLGWKKVAHDGREILNLRTVKGRKEYSFRKEIAAQRQRNVCCLFGECPTCPRLLLGYYFSFEHEFGRGHGGGKRDDRIEITVNGLTFWVNGAAHFECNAWKGSRVIAYNDAHNARVRAQLTGETA